MSQNFDFFVLAGEDSGDTLGAKFLQDLKQQARNSFTIKAVGGPRMRKEKPQLLFPMEKLHTMGFFDVLMSFPRLLFYFFKTKKWILKHQPKNVILIDYPGFNLRLEKALKKAGFKGKLIHYVCPTVWAHGKKRIQWMQKNLDLLLALFPFEKEFLKKSSLNVQYVGHPLLEKIEGHLIRFSQKRTRQDLQDNKPEPGCTNQGIKDKVLQLQTEKNAPELRLGLFPGSREKEILLNLPLQLQALKEIYQKKPFQLFISTAHPHFQKQLRQIVEKNYPFPVTYISMKEHYQIMPGLDLAIAKSGTVNLELAFFEVPTCVTYKIRKMELFIARKILKINLPFYCLVNILHNRLVFPELYGPNFTKENLIFHISRMLNEPAYRHHIRQACRKLKKGLKNQSKLNAAKAVLAYQQLLL